MRGSAHVGLNKIRGTLNCAAVKAPGSATAANHDGGYRHLDRWHFISEPRRKLEKLSHMLGRPAK